MIVPHVPPLLLLKKETKPPKPKGLTQQVKGREGAAGDPDSHTHAINSKTGVAGDPLRGSNVQEYESLTLWARRR